MNQIKLYLAFIVLFSTGMPLMAQSTETREVAPFNKISIRDKARVIIDGFGIQKVSVETEKSSDELKLKSVNDQLTISGSSGIVHITVPELIELNISGVGSISSDSVLKTDHLTLDISGSGKMKFPVDVKTLDVDLSGNGKINVAGSAQKTLLEISGNGKIEAENLTTPICKTDISGVGKCSVDVKDQLILTISGTGAFYYRSAPPKLETHIDGIGKYGTFLIEENSTGQKDTLSVNVGSKKVMIIGNDDDNSYSSAIDRADTIFHHKGKSSNHWGGFELGFNTLMYGNEFNSSAPTGYEYLDLNSGKSINVNINAYAHDFQLYKRYLMFTTGVGLTLNNYRFTGDQTLRSDTNRVAASSDFTESGKQIGYIKNKLAVNYVTVPLLLQFNSSEYAEKSFHVAAGLLMSYKFNSHLKLVYYEDGNRIKTKRQDEFNINPFRVDATLRVGYRDVTLYASYALTDLFKNGRGPEVRPFQVGVCLVNW